MSGSQYIETALELATQDSCMGLCSECGNEQSSVEPDAEKYTCEECECNSVYGAEQFLLLFGC